MKYASLFFLLLLAAVSGCDNGEPGKTGSTAAVTGKSGGTAGDFYKRLTGKLNGKDVVVQLHKFDATVDGYYSFTETGMPVKLVNIAYRAADGHYILQEMANGGSEKAAQWDLVISQTGATGQWTSAEGKSYPVTLLEGYPEGSIPLNAFFYTDTARMFRSLPEPKAYVAYGVLFPDSSLNKGNAAFLRAVIAIHMNLEGDGNVPAGLETRAWRYFGNYRIDLKTLADSTASKEELSSGAYQYNTLFRHNVVYNDNKWLVLEDVNADYTGGAHGTYNASYQNLDLSSNKSLDLRDMITDTTALAPYLDHAVRRHFNLKQDEALSSRLLVDKVHVTTNVMITGGGITFVYQPYEIASYADGIVYLFISYNDLLPLLTPEFKKRLGLAVKDGVALRYSAYFCQQTAV